MTVIRVMRVLDLFDALEEVVPEQEWPSPMDLARLRGKQRKRASGRRTSRALGTEPDERAPFRWGDER